MIKAILVAGAIASFGAAAQAGTLLHDDFNGPDLSAPGAVGSGFAVGGGGATVSGGEAVVGTDGNAIDQNIYSLDTFNPEGTTLTWVLDDRPIYGAAGGMIGWAQPGIGTCAGCGPEIWLEARRDRIVFDVVDNNGLFRYWDGGPIGGSGPITLSMSLTSTGYSWSISDIGDSISSSGLWVGGFAVSDVMSAAGGNLSAFGGSRSDAPYAGDVARFTSVDISSVPEPASWALMLGGFGAIGGAMRGRRRSAVSFG